MRRVVVNQITFNHCFPIGILKHRKTENSCSLQRRGRSQCNFDRVKIFDYRTISALIIFLIAIQQVFLSHFPVQQVSAVRLVTYDQIVICNRWYGLFFVVQNPFYHSLHRCNLNTCFLIRYFILQTFHIINIIQSHQFFQFHFFEYVFRLFSQCCTIHQKQDSPKPLCFQKTVNHPKNRSGLAGSCRHGKEHFPFSLYDRFFCCLYCPNLIFPQIQPVFIPQEITGHVLQLFIALFHIFFQPFQYAFRTHPSLKGFRNIRQCTKI